MIGSQWKAVTVITIVVSGKKNHINNGWYLNILPQDYTQW